MGTTSNASGERRGLLRRLPRRLPRLRWPGKKREAKQAKTTT